MDRVEKQAVACQIVLPLSSCRYTVLIRVAPTAPRTVSPQAIWRVSPGGQARLWLPYDVDQVRPRGSELHGSTGHRVAGSNGRTARL